MLNKKEHTLTWDKEKGCPFCGNLNFTRLAPRDIISDIKCDICGAVFASPDLGNLDEAGKFRGYYQAIAKEIYLKYGKFVTDPNESTENNNTTNNS